MGQPPVVDRGNANATDPTPQSPRHRTPSSNARPAEKIARTLHLSASAAPPRWAGPIQAGDPIPNQTGTGTQGVVDPRDVAAVAVPALLADGHTGATYTLTGPELLSVSDQAAQLSDVLGRPLTTVDVPLEVARERMVAAGVDAAFVEVAIDGSAYILSAGNAVLTDDVQQILGRPPRTFRDWAHDHRDTFER